MGVRVAYGQKDNIQPAIDAGKIPTDSIIITKDDVESELLFYDVDGNLKMIAERTRFTTLEEAENWVKTYPCHGLILSIQNGSEWMPYIVQSDNSLIPIDKEVEDVAEVVIIDGGTSGNG